MAGNTLYYGDNLDILREKRYFPDESIDLVYLDPPFNSNATYNVLFAEHTGDMAASQIKAFEDTWHWDQAAAWAYKDATERGGEVSRALQAFRTLLGDSDMLAYLAMMAPRLVELQRVLKRTGSIYLHCDPTASHYLKLLMDAVFGQRSFRNEIVWCYRKWSVTAGQFARNHDVILFYSRAQKGSTFNPLFVPVSGGTMKRWKGQKQQAYFEEGRRKATSSKADAAQTPMPDWREISVLNPNAAERLGYPTQKPEALLERIILASSNEGDVVLDPFCGCGTATAAAQRLGRHWIGIDITPLAITLIKTRLRDAFKIEAGKDYAVVGEPIDMAGAQQLAQDDPHHFEWWALGLVGAQPAEQKKGADKGIDGRLYFHDEAGAGAQTKQIVFQVKAGHTGAAHVRDLRGVVDRERAAIGVLITMQEPTTPMRREAAEAGFYDVPAGFDKAAPMWTGSYPRLQVLTVGQLLAGMRVKYPHVEGMDRTFKRAPRATTPEEPHPELPLGD